MDLHRYSVVPRLSRYVVAAFVIVGMTSRAVSSQETVTLPPLTADNSSRLERVSDTTGRLAFTNLTGRPVRVWQVAAYNCVRVDSGCGVTDPHLDVSPGDTVTLRTFVVKPGFRLLYEFYWRFVPPANAASVALAVPASGPGTLLVAPVALAAEAYRPIGKSYSFEEWNMINLSRRIVVWLEQRRTANGDSLQIELSAARLPDSAGHVVGKEERWQALRTDDADDMKALNAIVERVRRAEARAAAKAIDTAEAMHAPALALPARTRLALAPRKLGEGQWGLCRYSAYLTELPLVVGLDEIPNWCEPAPHMPYLQYNTLVVINPAVQPIGQIVEVCAAYTTNIPCGWSGSNGTMIARVAKRTARPPTARRQTSSC